jgi:uncharacterized protein (TIGR03083 family)
MEAASTKANLVAAFDELGALIGDLQPDEWDAQSLCPDWTVRGVVCHTAAIENALCDWMPTDGNIIFPLHRISPFVDDSRSWSNEELGAETKRILAHRRAELIALDDDDFARRSMTPVGEGTYRRFMEIRCFDLWVHQRDMTIPLERPTDDGGPLAEQAVDEVEASIGYIVGKKIGAADGTGITFRLTGPVHRAIHAIVERRARGVERLDEPTVTVTTDSLAFVLLAAGRIDPQRMIDEGRITWTGDPELGDRAARNLAFTR